MPAWLLGAAQSNASFRKMSGGYTVRMRRHSNPGVEAVRVAPPTNPTERVIKGIERSSALDLPSKAFDAASSTLNESRAGPLLRGTPIGHALHPLLTDFPLGCWLSAGLLDLVGGSAARSSSRRLIGLGVLTAIPTALAGLAEWRSLFDRSTRRVAVVHATGNLVVVSLYLLSWLRRREGRRGAGTAWGMAGGLLAIFTGYLGGHLSFGRGVGEGERWPTVTPDGS